MRNYAFLLLFFICRPFLSHGVQIEGEIIDIKTKKHIANVSVTNIHTSVATLSDKDGMFSIEATKGDLIEFRINGYKLLRLRVPTGIIPPFFNIALQEDPSVHPEYQLAGTVHDFKRDSIRNYELYKTALNFPRLEGLDVIRHPFSALSKQNQRIWAFQKEYTWYEQQRYIDYRFNERLVSDLTGLHGDSVKVYMRLYRPGYEELRSMSDYTFYSHVKRTVGVYRRLRQGIRRSSN